MKLQKQTILSFLQTVFLLILPVSSLAAAQQSTRPIGRLLTSDPALIEGRSEWTNAGGDSDEAFPLIFSGNKISIHKGIALLELNSSQSSVGFCGITTVTILPSKNIMLYALQTGTISLKVSSPAADQIMTPDFVVAWKSSTDSPVKQGVVHLDAGGSLCVQNIQGTARITDQFSGAVMEVDPGLSVQLKSGGMNHARLSRGLDCGCSSDHFSFRTADSEPLSLLNPRIRATGENRPSSSANSANRSSDISLEPARPPVEARPLETAQVPPLMAGTSPERTRAEESAPPIRSDAAKSSADSRPMAQATLAISAQDLKQHSAKKSFGEKLKGFFHRMFSRKPRSAPADLPVSK